MKVDLVVLLLLFVVEFFFGGIPFLSLSLVGSMPHKISGSIPLVVGLLALISCLATRRLKELDWSRPLAPLVYAFALTVLCVK